MSSLKDRIINEIIQIEGGYSDDVADSGGKTKYGITETTARAYGYKGKMKDLPLWLAKEIYDKRYLRAIKFDSIAKMSELIAAELADTSVNMGPKVAAEFLQRSLNVLNRGGRDFADLRVDGDIGPKTLTALKAFLKKRGRSGERVLYKMLNALQGAFYVKLAERRSKDEKFVFGWFKNRVA